MQVLFLLWDDDDDFYELGLSDWPHPFLPEVGDGLALESFVTFNDTKEDYALQNLISDSEITLMSKEWRKEYLLLVLITDKELARRRKLLT